MTERELGTNGHKSGPTRTQSGRRHHRRRGGALRNALVLALVSVGLSSASPPAGASERPGQAASQPGPVWMCRPGQAPDPCTSSLAVSAITATGAVKPATWPRSALATKFDCFYVLPTNSLATTPNTASTVTPLETFIVSEQAAPLSTVCNVWAPVYRSQTWTSVKEGLAGNEKVMTSTFKVAYQSILPAWDWFLSHTGGKPVVLVGDSQGSAVLIHLISAELDHEPSVLGRLVVAVLVGGNLQVPSGKAVGATFTRVPLCTSDHETACAIAFSSYPSEPPADAVFGRPGQGTSLQSGETAKAGQQVACVNPAALTGGTADLDPYVLTASQPTLTEHVTTPWVTYPGLYSASCKQGGGATWLQIASLAGTSQARPVVNDKVVGNYGGGSGPAWGYHSYEYGLTLGNLLQDIAHEEATWKSHR
jgi:Protein of unknown function (DUF3089)